MVEYGHAASKRDETVDTPDSCLRGNDKRYAKKAASGDNPEEEGAGQAKAFFSLAFLAAVIFLGIKIIPPYVDNYQLQDHIQELCIHLAVRAKPVAPEEIRDEVVAFAREHGIPVMPENVKVTLAANVSISLSYTVPVDLKVYTLNLPFSASAEYRTL